MLDERLGVGQVSGDWCCHRRSRCQGYRTEAAALNLFHHPAAAHALGVCACPPGVLEGLSESEFS